MTNRNKLQQCLRLAREASRDSWQVPGIQQATRQALRKIRSEAIDDARYWKQRL